MSSPSPYGPSAVAAPAPIPPTPRGRGLGIASLVVSLVPIAIALIFVVLTIVGSANDDTGWAILGWVILGAYVIGPLGVICGPIALGLGIAAVAKNRGRALGIAGIVLGGLILLFVLAVIGQILFSAAL